MIDPKSLRIGNTVNWCDKPIAITGKDLMYLSEMTEISQPCYSYQPIPLSEQELIRLGFKKWRKQYSFNVGGELFYYWDNGVFVIWQINEGAYTLDSVFRGVSSPKPSRVFNEVHVLQNIAYYLHGQELQYKVENVLTPTEQEEDNDPVVKIKPVSEYEIKVSSIKKVTPTEPDTKEPSLTMGNGNWSVIGSNGIINGEHKE